MNKVLLMGRFVRDPEIRVSQEDGKASVVKFSLAVGRRFKSDGAADADFINCVAFGKTGEVIEKYCRKGMLVGVTGRLQAGSYTNKDGQKVYTTDVIVDEIDFAESKKSDGYQDNIGQQSSYPSGSRNEGKPVNDEGFINIPDGIDEDLPFN